MKFDVVSYKINDKEEKISPMIIHNVEPMECEEARKLKAFLEERTPDIGVIEIIEEIDLPSI